MAKAVIKEVAKEEGPERVATFDDVVESGGAIVAQDDGEGYQPITYAENPEFDATEVAYPRIRLAQQLTPEVVEHDAEMGQWLCTGFEPAHNITFIPQLFGRSRKRTVGPNNDLVCTSSDAITGRGDPGGSCVTCPMAQWGPRDVATGKGTPPSCNLAYRYVGYAVEWDTICELVLARTGTTAAKSINTMIRSRGLGAFAVKLGSVKQTNSRRQAFASPTVFPVKVDKEVLEGARLMLQGGPVAGDDGAASPF